MSQTTRAKGVSIVVCCYNSSGRLHDTLAHLLEQQVNADLKWEIIVVNNNSSDDTGIVANDILASARQQVPYKVVDEPKPGLSNARKRGYDTAKYEYLLLVDDDNWLNPSYVKIVFDLFEIHPDVGIIGGHGIPKFEVAPPVWFNEYSSCYALGAQAETSGSGTWAEAKMIYGAGLALRMTAYDMLYNAGYQSILSDRKGDDLISGGDTELCLAMALGPFKLIYDNRLTFMHLMPAGRINWPYLRKLTYGFGKSTVKTQIYQHYILGNSFPSDKRRFPLWFDRWLNLAKTFPDHLSYIVGIRAGKEGDKGEFDYLGWKGRLAELWSSRSEYENHHRQIADLAIALKDQKAG